MPTKIDSGGGYQQGYDDGNSAGYASGNANRANRLHFPDGWSLHSTALGESFPGFSSNVIPVCMNQTEWANGYFYWDAVQVGVDDGKTNYINGVGSAYVNYKKKANGSRFSDITLSAANLFLPAFFGFDWSAIQNNIKSGTITVWLTRD